VSQSFTGHKRLHHTIIKKQRDSQYTSLLRLVDTFGTGVGKDHIGPVGLVDLVGRPKKCPLRGSVRVRIPPRESDRVRTPRCGSDRARTPPRESVKVRTPPPVSDKVRSTG